MERYHGTECSWFQWMEPHIFRSTCRRTCRSSSTCFGLGVSPSGKAPASKPGIERVRFLPPPPRRSSSGWQSTSLVKRMSWVRTPPAAPQALGFLGTVPNLGTICTTSAGMDAPTRGSVLFASRSSNMLSGSEMSRADPRDIRSFGHLSEELVSSSGQ